MKDYTYEELLIIVCVLLMSEKMFCFQCEQTSRGKGCTTFGVCGKNPEVAALQDLLIYLIRGLSQLGLEGKKVGIKDEQLDSFICEATFTTITNVNFDPETLITYILKAAKFRNRLVEKVRLAGGQTDLHGPVDLLLETNQEGLVRHGKLVGVKADPSINPELVMTRIEDWNGSSYQFYKLRYRRYDVTLPSLGLSLNISISNPSNYSKLGNFGIPDQYATYLSDVSNLWVSRDNNSAITFLPDANNVENLMIGFSNVTTQTVNFNITYYQQFLSRNVTVEEIIDYGEWENNTKSESYYFWINNNENSTLHIPYFELNGLAVLNSSELEKVEVYINNNLVIVWKIF